MRKPLKVATDIYLSFQLRWPHYPVTYFDGLAWPFLENRRAPEPPGLNLDNLDVLLEVINWVERTKPHLTTPGGSMGCVGFVKPMEGSCVSG